MRLSEIEKKAKSLGIKDTWRLSKKELIKTIQRKEGNFDCFGSGNRNCDQLACSWRGDCIR
ncbi:MAG: SAP domain-containing protein [Candidatus Omnitrophica bacterium]|nr:SAP domain-containing protein [Candidatus Omnitrophota bacterium]